MKATQIVASFLVDGEKVIVRYPAYPKARDLEGIIEVIRDHRKDPVFMGPKKGRITKAHRKCWRSQLWANRNVQNVVLLVQINNEVQGGIVIGKPRGAGARCAPWWVPIVIVARKYRHKGIGQRLFRIALSEARKKLKARKIGLMVAVLNVNALRMYRSCGFREVEVVKKHRKWGGRLVDYMQMVKRL